MSPDIHMNGHHVQPQDEVFSTMVEENMGGGRQVKVFGGLKGRMTQPTGRGRGIQRTDGIKYFTGRQIRLLREAVEERAIADLAAGKVTAVREWMVVDLLTTTGLRVSEVVDLRCGDLRTGFDESALFVRKGKGSKSRTVQIPGDLKEHLLTFLEWKGGRGESIGDDDFLFVGQRGPWTVVAVQLIVRKYLKVLGLYQREKSVHALRHSYAVEFYRQERDLRALHKQLGHASILTTQVYADVTQEDIQNQIQGLWTR
jgi:site-specific recombinase XerD